MRAILLAAGYGSRLGHLTKYRPKSLIDLGGSPLIEHNLRSLQHAGVEEVCIVVGHFSDQIIHALTGRFPPGFLRFIENPDYPSGSGSSLLCAAEAISESVFIIEADLLFHRDVPARMAEPEVESAIAIGHYGNNQVEGQISVVDGKVSGITWAVHDGRFSGEWIGFTKLSSAACDELRETLRAQNKNWKKDEFQYSKYLFDLMPHHTFSALSIDDLPWIEIDNELDLAKARSVIIPQIENSYA